MITSDSGKRVKTWIQVVIEKVGVSRTEEVEFGMSYERSLKYTWLSILSEWEIDPVSEQNRGQNTNRSFGERR